jgi:3-methyl-2-oxobutanoate hydroxymethyltransferase
MPRMSDGAARKVTAPAIRRRKGSERIVALTAYDMPTAKLCDEAGIDLILVGDSLGPNVLGYESTLPVTLDEMIAACRAVKRGVVRALVVGDLPFATYQAATEDAVRSALRFVKEGGAEAVKMEGGAARAAAIRATIEAGVPVMGHIGLVPQSVHAMGGYRVQGKSREDADALLRDATAVCDAGAFAIVLEGIPAALAAEITARVPIPTIGIGAGSSCDGQILVFTDVVGLNFGHVPKFVRAYADLRSVVSEALAQFRKDVVDGSFPSDRESY